MRPASTAPLMPLTSLQLLHAHELPDGWNKCTCQELSICDMLITLQLRRLLSPVIVTPRTDLLPDISLISCALIMPS